MTAHQPKPSLRRRSPAASLRRAGLGAVAALVLLSGLVGHAQLRGVKADVVPFVERDSVAAGGPVRLALQITLPDGFHTQSNKPRDESLIPTVLTVTPPDGVTVEELVFPPASDFAQEGQAQPLAVFEHQFAIGVKVALAPGLTGPIEIPARLRYQACDAHLCYAPVSMNVTWTVKAGAAGPVPANRKALFDAIRWGTGEAPGAAAATPGASVAAPATAAAPPAGGAQSLAGLDDFTVVSTTGGYLNVTDFLRFVTDAEQGVSEKGMFEGRGPLAILLLVFLGGLALNLTPCVLPMIPINLAIIGAGAQAGSRQRGFVLGAVYGAAMAVVYGVLGLVVILTAGTFGTINASPWFNVGIAAVFVVLALAMFDVIMIDFTRFSTKVQMGGAQRGSFVLAFGMGAVAALLAGACVAPVVIQVVVLASDLYAKGSTAALALPFLLGVGMALPWPLAGAGFAALPKPGAWMVRVKQGFGVLILGMAAYYGYTAYGLFADRFVDASAVNTAVEEKLKAGWHASIAEGLAKAKQEQKPVLIDLWATWCKNCLTMDKTTFEDASVKAALEGYIKIKFQAEQPDEEPARGVMQRFGAVGLPTYVILKPKSGVADATATRPGL